MSYQPKQTCQRCKESRNDVVTFDTAKDGGGIPVRSRVCRKCLSAGLHEKQPVVAREILSFVDMFVLKPRGVKVGSTDRVAEQVSLFE